MSVLSIEVLCSCGEKHRVPLDASGHYYGPQPCDVSKRWELQIEPDEWREMVKSAAEKRIH